MSRLNEVIKFPKAQLYTRSFIKKRIAWLNKELNMNISYMGRFCGDPLFFKGNIENIIGACQIPIGLAGPLKVNGEFAKGLFYVPLATTEGALVLSYHQGMRIVTEAGGVTTKILKDFLHISPIFIFYNTEDAKKLANFITDNFQEIKRVAENTTKYGKLLKIVKHILKTKVILQFCYTTGDAMGMNMINNATNKACEYILKTIENKIKVKRMYLRSNFSSDKKVSMFNIKYGYGKDVMAEAYISAGLLKKYFNISGKELIEFYKIISETALKVKMIGLNGQVANGLTAIFIACGQDVASIVNSHICFTKSKLLNNSFYIKVRLPNLVIGTVGGGTGLYTQKECLEILSCYGSSKAKKFAEIIAGAALAGEISIGASIINNTFAEVHEKYGRNRPKEKNILISGE